MRWSRADAHSSGDTRGGRATPAYPFANEGCYNDPSCYCSAYACRYAAGNPNGDVFLYALSTCSDAPADDHNNEHADAPADDHFDANAGSHTHTDLASDDL